MLLFCAPCAPAVALAPGVHYDPNSPAGKQYVIPLRGARQQGAAGVSSRGDGGASGPAADPGGAPLFGVGITPRPSAGSRAHVREAAPSSSSPPLNSGSAPTPSLRLPGRDAYTQRADARPSSLSEPILVLIVVVGVILLGGLTALAVRGSGRRSSSGQTPV